MCASRTEPFIASEVFPPSVLYFLYIVGLEFIYPYRQAVLCYVTKYFVCICFNADIV